MKKKKTYILLFISFNLLVVGVKSQIKKADRYYDAGFIDESIVEYEKATLSNKVPKKLHAYKRLAQAYYLNQNYSKTIEAYAAISNLGDTLSKEESYQYAQCLRTTGDYKKAKEVLKNSNHSNELIQKFCHWPMTHLNLTLDLQITKSNMALSKKYLGMTFIDSNRVLLSKSYVNESDKTAGYQLQPGVLKDHLFLSNLTTVFQTSNTLFESTPYFNDRTNELFYSKNYLTNSYYLGNNNDSRKVNQHYIYQATFKDGQVNSNQLLPMNSPEYSSTFPYLYKDSVLFFCSNNPIGKGGMDIFYITRDANGKWSTEVHLLPGPNTFENEVFPFIWKDDFYFSSRGFEGYGGMDIYRGKLNYTNGEYHVSDISNLGQPVNGSKDDFGLLLISDYKGYFASNRDSVYDQIYLLNSRNKKWEDFKLDSLASENSMLESMNLNDTKLEGASSEEPGNVQKIKGKVVEKENNSALIQLTLSDLETNNEWVPNKVLSINDDGHWQFDKDPTKTQKLVISTTYGKYALRLEKNEKPTKENLELLSNITSSAFYNTLMNSSLSNVKLSKGMLSAEIIEGLFAEIDLEAEGISSGLNMPKELSKIHPIYIHETTQQVYYNNGNKLIPILENSADSLAGIQQLVKLLFIKKKLKYDDSNLDFHLSFNDDKNANSTNDGLLLAANGYFDYNSFQLNAQLKELMKLVYQEVQNNVLLNVSLKGYTDGIGSAKYNNILSTKRANSCQEYLTNKGLNANRIFTKGMGETLHSQYHNYKLRNTNSYIKSRKVQVSLFFTH